LLALSGLLSLPCQACSHQVLDLNPVAQGLQDTDRFLPEYEESAGHQPQFFSVAASINCRECQIILAEFGNSVISATIFLRQ